MRIAPSMNHEWHLQCITDCTRPAIQKSYWSYKEQSTLIHTPLPLPPSDLLQKVMHFAGHCAVASLLCPRIHIDAMSASVPHRSRHVRRREVLHEPLGIDTLLEGAMRHGLAPLPPSDLLHKVMHFAGHCAVASLLCPRIHIDAMSASVPHRSRHVHRREVLHEPLGIDTLLEGAMRHGLGQGACHPRLFGAKATLVVNENFST